MQRSEGDERHRALLAASTTLPSSLEVSALAIVASPRPFLVSSATDVNRNGSLDDDPTGHRTYRARGWEHWYRTVDVRLGRSMSPGRGRLEVSLDAFIVLNTGNHAEYRGTQGASDFGEPIADFARRKVQVGARFHFWRCLLRVDSRRGAACDSRRPSPA